MEVPKHIDGGDLLCDGGDYSPNYMTFHLYLDFFIDHLLYYIFPIQISEKYSGDHPGDGGDQQNPTEWESECLAYGQTRGVGAS